MARLGVGRFLFAFIDGISLIEDASLFFFPFSLVSFRSLEQRMAGWPEQRMDGWMAGWPEQRMDGWMDG